MNLEDMGKVVSLTESIDYPVSLLLVLEILGTSSNLELVVVVTVLGRKEVVGKGVDWKNCKLIRETT